MFIPKDIKFKDLQRKLIEKFHIDEGKELIQINYVYPPMTKTELPPISKTKTQLPPIAIIDDDDLKAFKYLNSAYGEYEWKTELYTSVAERVKQDVAHSRCEDYSSFVLESPVEDLPAEESKKRKSVIPLEDIITLSSDDEYFVPTKRGKDRKIKKPKCSNYGGHNKRS